LYRRAEFSAHTRALWGREREAPQGFLGAFTLAFHTLLVVRCDEAIDLVLGPLARRLVVYEVQVQARARLMVRHR
jgi:hypothetical protein